MIDVNTETTITFPDAAQRLGVSLQTVHNWADGTLDGYRLESLRIGRNRFTSEEALQRFIEAQNEDQPEGIAETVAHRKKATKKALDYLKKEGVLK